MSAVICKIVKLYPNVNTRVLIEMFSLLPGVSKQKVCGHLSWLKRSNQIKINTLVPHKYSEAY